MKWNLKNRIAVPTVALVLTITIALSLVSFLKSRAMLNKTLDAQLNQQCAVSINEVESWVEANRQNLLQWAVEPQILAALANTPEAQTNRAIVGAEQAHAQQVYGCYENIYLVDLTGACVASSVPKSVGTLNVGDRQYFKDALAGQTVISPVLSSHVTGNPIVVISTPIKADGVVRGVLSCALDVNTFSSKFISPIKILQSGYAFMFDEQGVFIAHPDKTQILKTKLTDFDWGRQMLELHNGEVHYTLEGAAKNTIFKTSDVLHWGLAVTVPTAELNAPVYQMGRVNLLLSLGALTVGVVIMLLTARSITRPLQRLADGLTAGADQTTSAAAQVSASSQSLAEGSSEQAASLEETSSSLEEMSSMTKRNAENAQKANDLARQARTAADKGTANMQTMNAAMDAIKVSSDDIAKIIKTIDEIAFQTNILALNAAVEAARAGEAGMGFAVVADEVRNLAQRSAQAAKETAGKIEGAITKTAQGVDISRQVAEALNEIAAKARQVDELVTEVAGASREQTQGIAQVNTAVGQMDKVTQSNAASAEESAAAAEELNAQAMTMKESVAELLQLVVGKSQGTVIRTAAAPAHAKVVRHTAPKAKLAALVGGKGQAHRERALTSEANGRDEIPLEGDFKDF
ncbi:MAG: methyl-accepting chemotaxis protein [Verrucomicrobiae bacterium]|nr:methyl-accepting chemotaxis protein [Verrucomicrobiae bacterium]